MTEAGSRSNIAQFDEVIEAERGRWGPRVATRMPGPRPSRNVWFTVRPIRKGAEYSVADELHDSSTLLADQITGHPVVALQEGGHLGVGVRAESSGIAGEVGNEDHGWRGGELRRGGVRGGTRRTPSYVRSAPAADAPPRTPCKGPHRASVALAKKVSALVFREADTVKFVARSQ